jgi:DNA-binding NarL/FixJ family response regulator
VSVHLVTENRLIRDSLARMLPKRAGISVAGVSGSLDAAVEEIAASQCDVVLTDCLIPAGSIDLLKEVFDKIPDVKVVLFGMDENPETFLRSASLGVAGYVLKDASAYELISTVRRVAQGEAVCPPRLCMSLIQHVAQRSHTLPWPRTGDQDAANRPPLTSRQLELVGLVARGLTNKEIAANLNLSEFTVKNHMHRILKQVEASDRYEAVDVIRATGYLPSA